MRTSNADLSLQASVEEAQLRDQRSVLRVDVTVVTLYCFFSEIVICRNKLFQAQRDIRHVGLCRNLQNGQHFTTMCFDAKKTEDRNDSDKGFAQRTAVEVEQYSNVRSQIQIQ